MVATLALVVFILGLGDWRRRNTAVSAVTEYARELSARLGDGRALPLNLDVSPELQPRLRRLEWLTREEARRLRAEKTRLILAQTHEVRQYLGRNGRAVVFFDNGQFESTWVTTAEFDRLYTAQLRLLGEGAVRTDDDKTVTP
jgi:hypothetical protein